uniref:4Fe-4S ferredoxin iron-sulfur binding domain protein n=1 Tax=Nitratidesulfovibrio vulgaris (strain DSM 19637 / Miyazaki F) TaxID=883 RepID=B8DIZ1_NITV9
MNRQRVRLASRWLCLAAFVLLAWDAGQALPDSATLTRDLLVRLDPSVALTASIAGRAFIGAAVPGLVVLALSLLLGRAFCGWMCPFGTMVDAGDYVLRRLARGRRKRKSAGGEPGRHDSAPRPTVPRLPKYAVLAAMLAAALAGLDLVFWAAPLPLAARFWALAAWPPVARLAEGALSLAAPLARQMGATGLAFAEVAVPSYAATGYIVGFFVLVLAGGVIAPRLWCRMLCPAGAAMGLAGRAAPWRRRVEHACTACGACARRCPAGAIPAAAPRATDHAECLKCLRCADVCPVDAVRFAFSDVPGVVMPEMQEKPKQPDTPDTLAPRSGKAVPAHPDACADACADAASQRAVNGTAHRKRPGSLSTVPLPPHARQQRRALLAGLAAGACAAALGHAAPALGRPEGVLRPPGALPEPDFLARCVRCGLCAAACPTNTLQPAWLASGALGMFSPVVTPARGFCDPACHACARACPTTAIRRLADERTFAKIGTAEVLRDHCLAWAKKKRCLVCDEVCPYDAIALKPEPGYTVGVPHVDPARCAGCGFCEKHCPETVQATGQKAIIIRPRDALRIASGSMRAAAEARGLRLVFTPKKPGEAHVPNPTDATGATGAMDSTGATDSTSSAPYPGTDGVQPPPPSPDGAPPSGGLPPGFTE